MRLLVILCLSVFGFVGCKDNEKPVPIERSTNEVFIANEGNFGWGEGALSIYNPETKTIQNDVYKSKNGEALGNVFQSITRFNDHYFFVINNSGKIVVTDTNFNKIKTISGFTSPRYMFAVSNEKAYVTDLYSDAISVVDLANFTITKTIPFNGWSEKGVVFNNEFWCTAPESKYVYCIDIETDKLKDSVEIGFASESITWDYELQLRVLSKGDETKNIAPALTVINPLAKQKVSSLELSGLPSNLVFDHLSNTIYFLDNGIYKMQLSNDSEPQLWIPANGRNLYALGLNPNGQDIYVTDILDYVQKSSVSRYSQEGELLDEFKAGIIAGNFFFKD